MSKLETSLVDKLLKSDKKLSLCITGGGTGVIAKILENGGASNVFLGATVPYCEKDIKAIVGSVSKLCSAKVASLLSLNGYTLCSAMDFKNKECVCISSTSSLQKSGKEREDRVHEAYICVRVYDGNKYSKSTTSYHIVFKEKRTRKQEEDLLSKALLAISCSALTICKWELSTYKPMLDDFGFTSNDEIKYYYNKIEETEED